MLMGDEVDVLFWPWGGCWMRWGGKKFLFGMIMGILNEVRWKLLGMDRGFWVGTWVLYTYIGNSMHCYFILSRVMVWFVKEVFHSFIYKFGISLGLA